MIKKLGECCYFLSKIFSIPPSPVFLRTIIDQHIFTTYLALFSTETEIEVLENSAWLKKVSDIEVDFATLFSVPSQRKVALYESYYIDVVQIELGDWNDFSKTSISSVSSFCCFLIFSSITSALAILCPR